MNLFDEAKALARRTGRPQDAVAFIERKAGDGDPEGSLIVAHWHLYGRDRPRDVAAARQLLKRAADNGSTHAVRLLANLTAGGLGGQADDEKALGMLRSIAATDRAAAAQLDLLPRMTVDAAKAPRERLSSDPLIEVVRGLLTREECAYVMRLAEPSLRPSFVYDPETGEGKPDPIRRSEGAALLPHDEDLVIQKLNRRLAAATGTSVEQREALYIIRYRPGQEYRPHFDALPGLANQRAWTAITYLNEEFEGGATVFDQLSLSVRPGAGDVLIFTNVDAEGRPNPRMRHAGEPVTSGEKWIATRWIRQRTHDPYDNG